MIVRLFTVDDQMASRNGEIEKEKTIDSEDRREEELQQLIEMTGSGNNSEQLPLLRSYAGHKVSF